MPHLGPPRTLHHRLSPQGYPCHLLPVHQPEAPPTHGCLWGGKPPGMSLHAGLNQEERLTIQSRHPLTTYQDLRLAHLQLRSYCITYHSRAEATRATGLRPRPTFSSHRQLLTHKLFTLSGHSSLCILTQPALRLFSLHLSKDHYVTTEFRYKAATTFFCSPV